MIRRLQGIYFQVLKPMIPLDYLLSRCNHNGKRCLFEENMAPFINNSWDNGSIILDWKSISCISFQVFIRIK